MIEGEHLILGFHVDDFIVAYTQQKQIDHLLVKLNQAFPVKDFGSPDIFLGQQIIKNEHGIYLTQAQYIKSTLQAYGYANAHASTVPCDPNILRTDSHMATQTTTLTNYPLREIIGRLLWVSTRTRPDIAFAVSLAASFVDSKEHTRLGYAICAKVLRYLSGTKDKCIHYQAISELRLHGAVDADYASDRRDRKSRSGYVLFLSGGPIAWASKKQHTQRP